MIRLLHIAAITIPAPPLVAQVIVCGLRALARCGGSARRETVAQPKKEPEPGVVCGVLGV
jgi:hypothetical protein